MEVLPFDYNSEDLASCGLCCFESEEEEECVLHLRNAHDVILYVCISSGKSFPNHEEYTGFSGASGREAQITTILASLPHTAGSFVIPRLPQRIKGSDKRVACTPAGHSKFGAVVVAGPSSKVDVAAIAHSHAEATYTYEDTEPPSKRPKISRSERTELTEEDKNVLRELYVRCRASLHANGTAVPSPRIMDLLRTTPCGAVLEDDELASALPPSSPFPVCELCVSLCCSFGHLDMHRRASGRHKRLVQEQMLRERRGMKSEVGAARPVQDPNYTDRAHLRRVYQQGGQLVDIDELALSSTKFARNEDIKAQYGTAAFAQSQATTGGVLTENTSKGFGMLKGMGWSEGARLGAGPSGPQDEKLIGELTRVPKNTRGGIGS